MPYWMYSDQPTNKSKIHKATCRWVQSRKSTRKPNNWWHGPYERIELAESSLQNIGAVSNCGHCRPQGRSSAKVRVAKRSEVGATHLQVTVRNMAEPERTWEGLFRVDTGITDCMVPRQYLEAIGIVPQGQRLYELADGKSVRFDIAAARVEFMGEFVGTTIIFGDEGSEPLLGVTALESAGIEVDPRNETLKRLPAVRLKGVRG